MPRQEFAEELAVAKQAARRAGETMQQHRRDGFTIDRKSTYTDMVTEADHACEEVVVDTIRDAFPADGLLTEEETTNQDGDRVWVVVPIDGTTNFVHGFPHYCTSIALRVDGDPVVGVVHNPVHDHTYTAVAGQDAARNGQPLQVSDVDALRDALVITRLSDRHEPTREVENAFLRDLLRQPSSFRRIGSAALQCCYVAEGVADANVLVTIRDWDIAAGRLIVEEAGGTVRVQDAVRDGYLEIVASNGHVQDALEEMLDGHTAAER